MPAERTTIGKVTYIHGAEKLKASLIYGDDGQVVDVMMHGIDDPALQRQLAPIPVIVIGDDIAQPKPDEPSISYYFGTDIPRSDEPDEYEVWSPDKPSSTTSKPRVKRYDVLLWSLIIPMIILMGAAILVMLSDIPFAEFFQNVANGFK